MECRGSATELAQEEGDGWFAAAGVLVWRIAGIDGASFWGHVGTEQLDAAFAVVRQYATAPPARPIRVVTDLSAMTTFDDAVYPRMVGYVAELVPVLAPQVCHHVVVVPESAIRATAAGFLHLHADHGWRLAADLREAAGHEIAERVDALVAAHRGADLVTALRSRLPAETLPDAARSIGVAPRTLQRALRGAGTSFRTLVEERRIAEACRLLDETDLKVEAIAREVGYESLSGFVRSFRRVHGCTPHQRRLRRSA